MYYVYLVLGEIYLPREHVQFLRARRKEKRANERFMCVRESALRGITLIFLLSTIGKLALILKILMWRNLYIFFFHIH